MRVTRRVLGVGVVLALLFFAWRSRGDESTPPPAVAKQRVAKRPAKQASVRTAPRPRAAWFAQRGTGRRIAGIVTTGDGAPVRGARVRLSNTVVRARLLAEPTVLTDDAGRFDLGIQPAMNYLISGEAAGLTTALSWIDTSTEAARPAADALHLLLQPCVASIHGTIVDAAGGVVPSARVSRSDWELPTTSGVDTDARGAYELCVPPGPASVEVSADGYAPIITQVNVFGRTRRDFELVPGATVVGRIVRAADNQPVADALVELTAVDRMAVVLRARSDDQGRFEIEGVVPGRHRVTASADGLTTLGPVAVTAEIGAPGEEVVCPLVAAYSVAGKIVEKDGGKSIEGFALMLVPNDGSGAMPLTAVSRADGTFVVERVVPGAYSVATLGEGEGTEHGVTVKAADVEGVVIELARGARITGRVLREGKPVVGALVRIEDGPNGGHSDAEGRFTIPYVPPGEYQLYAESLRDGAFTRTKAFTIAAGENKTMDLELDLAGAISGVVVDERGAPVPDVFVKFSLIGGDDIGMATTAADGSFTARGLSGGGDYGCVVRQHDGSALVFAPATGEDFAPVPVADGKTHVTGVRMMIRHERFAISGSVLADDGTPQVDILVTASPPDEELEQEPSATTDARGAFTLRDLPAGSYTVLARSTHGDVRADDVEAGRTGLIIRMRAFATIKGTLVGFSSTPEVFATGSDDEVYGAEVDGASFTFHAIPTGTYGITVVSDTERGNARVVAPTTSPVAVTVTREPVGAIATDEPEPVE